MRTHLKIALALGALILAMAPAAPRGSAGGPGQPRQRTALRAGKTGDAGTGREPAGEGKSLRRLLQGREQETRRGRERDAVQPVRDRDGEGRQERADDRPQSLQRPEQETRQRRERDPVLALRESRRPAAQSAGLTSFPPAPPGASSPGRRVETFSYSAGPAGVRRSWTKRTTVAPSPTAVAQRLIEPARTSPAA